MVIYSRQSTSSRALRNVMFVSTSVYSTHRKHWWNVNFFAQHLSVIVRRFVTRVVSHRRGLSKVISNWFTHFFSRVFTSRLLITAKVFFMSRPCIFLPDFNELTCCFCIFSFVGQNIDIHIMTSMEKESCCMATVDQNFININLTRRLRAFIEGTAALRQAVKSSVLHIFRSSIFLSLMRRTEITKYLFLINFINCVSWWRLWL